MEGRAYRCGHRGRGGEGKTALVNAWLGELGKRGGLEGKRVYGWTFYPNAP
jgi:hypothetical protein